MSRVRRRELNDELEAGILLLACVMLPALFIFGSKRFIVPVIPLIALFQGYAIVATARQLFQPGKKSELTGFERGGSSSRPCSNSLPPSSGKVVAIKVHHLDPRSYEVLFGLRT